MTETYLALYRKYRPATFDDVVGQDNAVNLLVNSIKQKKIAHAYLFCGGRGTGKTSVARIVAREIGCNPEDIIEIDAASNRGIDEIRELREAVRTMPFSSPYKVYIIDEAHMLTKEAANALLKTLEEPPAHVVFILATTDPEKLPETIVSRCQKVVFSQPTVEVLGSRLVYVAKEEGFDLPDESAALIAHHGNGSYRDALGVLEKIFRISKKKVDHADVISMLGVTDRKQLILLLEAFSTKNVKEVSHILTEMQSKGAHALRVYDEFIELMREALLIRVGEEKPAENNKDLAKLAQEYPKSIASASILALLSKRHLLSVSEYHGWTAFAAILIDLVSE